VPGSEAYVKALEELRAGERTFRLLFENHPQPMWVYDLETGRVLAVNEAAIAKYGFSRDEFLALTIGDIRPPEEAPLLLRGTEADRTAPECADTWRHRLKDGRIIDVEITTHEQEFSGHPAVLVMAQDVTDRRALEEQLRHQTFHDVLTGLPNRALLTDRLDHALSRSSRHGSMVGVLFCDVDRFKVINDSLGHISGDAVLVTVAERIRSAVRPEDTVARFGGDEFVVLCEDLASPRDAIVVADRVVAVTSRPIRLGDRDVVASLSVGVAVAGPGTRDAHALLRDGDAAMYRAKAHGRARSELFDDEMRLQAMARLEVESALRYAVEHDQLRLVYQPAVDLRAPRVNRSALMGRPVTAVEALLRWDAPGQGLIRPAEFVPVAEETGLIEPIGVQVLRQACRQATMWRDSFGVGTTIAVNLSARQLAQPDIVGTVARILEETDVAPSDLCLEITESALLGDVANAAAVIGALQSVGVQLCVDDFGTGYASLAYLKRFPVQALKIDRSFVSGLGDDRLDTALVAAVVDMAHALGMRAIAEGVETETQLAALVSLGCDAAQGYLFARPAFAEDVTPVLGRAIVGRA